MRTALLLSGCALALMACGDNTTSSGDDDGGAPDARVADAGPPPDVMFCPAPGFGQVGGPCAQNSDCDSSVGAGDGLCYFGTSGGGGAVFPPEGYCTLDDNSTGTVCATDNDCGTGNVCVDFLDFSPYHVCMPACTCGNNDECPDHQACRDSFNGFALDKAACVPGQAGAQDGDACAGLYECDDYSQCLNDSLEFPGGQCGAYGCTVGDDSTCHGGVCADVDEIPLSGTFCLDACTDDSDCREAEGYACFDPGGGGTKYCRHPHVGDPCATAADCGTGSWTFETGATFPGGYCTQNGCPNPGSSADQCSPGSVCTDPLVGANYCADRCDTADIGTQGRCRTGYMCLDVDPGAPTTGGCVPPASL